MRSQAEKLVQNAMRHLTLTGTRQRNLFIRSKEESRIVLRIEANSRLGDIVSHDGIHVLFYEFAPCPRE